MRYLVIILLLGSLAQCIVAVSDIIIDDLVPADELIVLLPIEFYTPIEPPAVPEVVVPYTIVKPDLPAPPELNISLNLSNQSLLNLSNSAVISSLEKACPCSPT